MKRGEIAPQEQFLLFSTIFCNLVLVFCVKIRTRFSLRDKRLFEIIEVEITRVGYIKIISVEACVILVNFRHFLLALLHKQLITLLTPHILRHQNVTYSRSHAISYGQMFEILL